MGAPGEDGDIAGSAESGAEHLARAEPPARPSAGLGRYGHRRPRRGLTRQVVVDAALRVVARDGLDGLTMRAVAVELNTATTSLYRHIADRDALLTAMLASVASGLPVAVPGRTPLERVAARLVGAHDLLADWPWVPYVLVTGQYVAAESLAFDEANLADLLAAGLDVPAAALAYRSCWHLLVGELLDQHAAPAAAAARRLRRAAIPVVDLPALAQAGPLLTDAEGDSFAHGVALLLRAVVAGAPSGP
ncbi:transcriptional regulator, TetR family [Parafrankia sp. EAN1pec]|uniref:TetR/AcrR family transcriptional regulator n=1 Tax=Parafrankia sp. (strain EAN1pec) TaxID=298653 RepID=UPI0000543CFA|nr:transcriptional regulator, TetR family [Frankia sp. EAN1pec]